MEYIIALVWFIGFIALLIAIDKIRIHCDYCKTKTVYCTGVETKHGVIWVCEKCGREYI